MSGIAVGSKGGPEYTLAEAWDCGWNEGFAHGYWYAKGAVDERETNPYRSKS